MNNKKYLSDLKTELDKYAEELSKLKDSFKGKSKREMENISQSLESLLEEAKKSYKKLESASAEKWEPLKEIASQSFEDLKRTFDESLNASAKKVRDYAHQFNAQSQEKIDLISEYVKDNSLKSALFALGLGIIVGKIVK